ncbi:MAG TPA: CHC2 zinc finger domain-containing protein, partial [Arachidicoccus sp.]|nr:CHC2 zinc finger domain-containing protein [Arachidicoccus sp.]
MFTSIFKRLKEQNMVLFLERLGHLPKKQNGQSFWYLSPFRDEKTPSFQITAGKFGLDLYWDFGTGDHGNMVDFCCKYYNMTPKELYHHITTGGTSFFFDQQNLSKNLACQKRNKGTGYGLIVKTIKTIEHPSLVRYLRTRAILPELYSKFCKEIHYQVGDRKYFAIGFSNDMGGWELRNAYFKGATSPKSYSKIGCGADSICVFEGFMDFLSYLTIIKLDPGCFAGQLYHSDFLILNSL